MIDRSDAVVVYEKICDPNDRASPRFENVNAEGSVEFPDRRSLLS
jgi:hypothetical protein